MVWLIVNQGVTPNSEPTRSLRLSRNSAISFIVLVLFFPKLVKERLLFQRASTIFANRPWALGDLHQQRQKARTQRDEIAHILALVMPDFLARIGMPHRADANSLASCLAPR